jgi:hypothetical protein
VPAFLVFTGLYMLGGTSYFGAQLAATRLAPADRQAFDWIRANTPLGSRFLVLTGNTEAELFCDAPLEWFPTLTQRISLTTIQGKEWQEGGNFDAITANARAASACLTAESPLSCVESLTSPDGHPLPYDFLYVARSSPVLSNCRVTGTSRRGERLFEQLESAASYVEAYASPEAAVFKTMP